MPEVLSQARAAAGEPPAQDNPPAWQDKGETPWGIQRVSAPQAWKAYTGKGVKVAVIDTGIDAGHPDLAARVAGGFNAINSSATAHDDHGHGTHVSGTVGATADNSGVVGVAPQVALYGVKVLDANGSGWIADIISGIDWAVAQKVDVINMSLGGSRGNDSFHEAVKKAAEAGVAVVCAAGNSGAPRKGSNSSVGYPAAYPEAIAVAASDSSDKLAYFSSRGPEVDLIGPGVDVKSTIPGGGYDNYSGTSMASPHLAGLAALAVSAGAKGEKGIRAALTNAARKLPGLTPNDQGAGMPDAAKLTGVFRIQPIGSTR
jgi:subtilisin